MICSLFLAAFAHLRPVRQIYAEANSMKGQLLRSHAINRSIGGDVDSLSNTNGNAEVILAQNLNCSWAQILDVDLPRSSGGVGFWGNHGQRESAWRIFQLQQFAAHGGINA